MRKSKLLSEYEVMRVTTALYAARVNYIATFHDGGGWTISVDDEIAAELLEPPPHKAPIAPNVVVHGDLIFRHPTSDIGVRVVVDCIGVSTMVGSIAPDGSFRASAGSFLPCPMK